jgi:Uma2 family endonuclease
MLPSINTYSLGGGEMSEALAQKKTRYTKEEYLALEEQAEYKSEYYNGEIFAMAGGSHNHSVICVNLNWRLGEALINKDCIVLDSNMKLDIAKTNLFVYPDAMVVCGEIEFFENRTDIIKNPVLIIEILSPSTQAFDRSQKFAYYRSVPSVQEYVLVSQTEPRVEVFYKQDEKTWIYTVAEGLEEAIVFQTIQQEFALKDIYQKVDWKQAEEEQRRLEQELRKGGVEKAEVIHNDSK